MGNIFLTADLHIGEAQTPNTHSFLRPKPTAAMVDDLVDQCHKLITPADTLIIVGDVGITLGDLATCSRLPDCEKILILGDKEYASKHFTQEEFMLENERLGIFTTVTRHSITRIAGREYFLSHKPRDCINPDHPAICGHVHGIWRSAKLPSGQPIINVGLDAWSGGIVTEEFIAHQYNAITKDYYDSDCFPSEWKRNVLT